MSEFEVLRMTVDRQLTWTSEYVFTSRCMLHLTQYIDVCMRRLAVCVRVCVCTRESASSPIQADGKNTFAFAGVSERECEWKQQKRGMERNGERERETSSK